MHLTRACVEIASTPQALLLGFAITMLKEHTKEGQRIEMRTLPLAQRTFRQIGNRLIDFAPAPPLVGVGAINHHQFLKAWLETGLIRASPNRTSALHGILRAAETLYRDWVDGIRVEPEHPQQSACRHRRENLAVAVGRAVVVFDSNLAPSGQHARELCRVAAQCLPRFRVTTHERLTSQGVFEIGGVGQCLASEDRFRSYVSGIFPDSCRRKVSQSLFRARHLDEPDRRRRSLCERAGNPNLRHGDAGNQSKTAEVDLSLAPDRVA